MESPWRPAVRLLLLLCCGVSLQAGTGSPTSNDVTWYGLWRPTRSTVPGAAVSDLAVQAVLLPDSQAVRLRVNWTPPTRWTVPDGFRLPAGYRVHLHLLNASEPYCSRDSATISTATVPNPAGRSVTVPEPLGFRMRIRPECSYRVQVESQPSVGLPHLVTADYRVPECVEQLCRCRSDALPTPTNLHREQLRNRDLNLTWTLPGSWAGQVVIKLSEETFRSNSQRPVFNLTWRTELRGGSPYYSLVPGRVLQPGHLYLLQVFASSSGCEGPPANTTFRQEAGRNIQPANTTDAVSTGQEQHKDKGQMLLLVALPIVSIAFAVCLAVAMLWQRCGSWVRRKMGEGRLQPIHSWRGVYKAVSMESRISRINFPTLQERNIIYVEQEIEEAKARGDADSYEVSYSRLELGRQIGKGAFGRVFLARAEAIAGTPGFMTVAVKKLKHRASSDEVEEFVSEIAMMKRVGRHHNVVTMLGCCTLREPLCMLMEYVPCGDLLHYLRRLRAEYEREAGGAFPFSSTRLRPAPRYVDLLTRDSDSSYVQPEGQRSTSSGRPSITETEWSQLSCSQPASPAPMCHKLECVLDPRELQNFAVQIARGMAHLEQKHITHRDLAARNVLIDENKTLKISDFGLSRSGVYVNTRRKKVPLRWLSVEAMRDNLYSSKSDVWAFAIVLWEIGTLGGFPYPSVADADLLAFLEAGRRLDKPDNCSEDLYALMLQCWSHLADMRPSFAELVAHLDSVMMSRKRVYVDFSALKPNYTFPPTEQQPRPSSK